EVRRLSAARGRPPRPSLPEEVAGSGSQSSCRRLRFATRCRKRAGTILVPVAAEKSTKSAAAPFEGNHSIAELAEVGFPGPAGAVNTTGGIRRDWLYGALASLLSAVLYVVSFPPFGVAECAYVFAIPLLLWLMAKRRPWKQVALISLAWGMLSWLALIVWLRHVTYGGYFVVSA